MTPLTQSQAVLLSAYTGFNLVSDFSTVHKFIEEVLERQVEPYELADESLLNEVRTKLRPTLLSIIPD